MKPSLAGACALILLAAPLARAAEPPAASTAPPAPASAPSASTLPDLPTTIDIAPAAPKNALPPLSLDPAKAPPQPLALSSASPLDSRTLARKIIAAMGVDHQVEAGADARVQANRTQILTQGKALPPDKKKALAHAFADATTGPKHQMVAEIVGTMTIQISQKLSHDELAQVLSYMESPVGQAQTHAGPKMTAQDRATAEATIAANPALVRFFNAWREAAPAIQTSGQNATMLFAERFNARFCRNLVAAGLSHAPACPAEPK